MKKKIYLFTILILSCLFTKNIYASSVTISASANYITNGNKVTFYIKINDAASWILNGSGIGSTYGCSLGDERVGDSGTGKNTTKTLSVTCTSSSTGIISFGVTGSIWDENYKETAVNTSKTVTVQAPRQLDTNNYLKTLEVKGYTLTPEFNKETLEYTVNVPSTVNKITIDSSLESNYASLIGNGEFEVNEGANGFEVKVTSETGVERVYKLTVHVKDENPIDIKIDNNNYTIMKNAKTLEAPATYEATTVKINEMDIPAFYSETSSFTLIGVKDTEGKQHFAIYNEENSTYKLYNENKSDELILYIENIKEEKEGFIKTTIEINGVAYDSFTLNEKSNFYVIYAMNITTGKKDYYIYNKEEKTFSQYNDELNVLNIQYQKELEKYKIVIISFAGVTILLILIIFILILKRKKKTKKKEKKQKEIEEVNEDLEKETKKDNQKEEEKIEETMFDILKENKKKGLSQN